jgi:phosphate transport system substrate-binding protein
MKGNNMKNNTRNQLIKWGVALSAVATLVAGCSAPQNQNPAPPTTPATTPASNVSLTGAGSTFIYPILSKWVDVYHDKASVEINYQSVGSGAGIKQIKNQTVDFGATDAPLDDADLKTMPKNVLQIPAVAGAEAVSYNLPNVKQPVKLDGAVLADMFLGNITKWNDPKIAALNAGIPLPPLPVTISHRSDGSGTTYIFTSYLSAVSPAWKSKVGAGKSVSWPVGIGGKGNSGVAGVIKQTPGAIGYVELAYAQQNKLSFAMLKNKSGKFVAPTVDATTAAIAGSIDALKKDIRSPIINASGDGAYPIAGMTYVLAYEDTGNAEKGSAIQAFLKWAIGDGQQMSKELYYAPLPPAVVAINEKNIAKIH